MEHVAVAERAFGRPLPDQAVVHHHDEDKLNNSNGNLVICEDEGYHRLIHARMRVIKAGGIPEVHKICATCKCLKVRTEFYSNEKLFGGLSGVCRECSIFASLIKQELKRFFKEAA